MANKKQWASGMGFVLATAGSAIGLGNLWKFPYLMGKNGGFVFLIAYLVFTLLLGLPVMLIEISLGRYTGKDPVGAFRSVQKKSTFIGVLGVTAAFFVLSYYCVIGGWILKYILSYCTTFAAPESFEAAVSNTAQSALYHLLFLLVVVLICMAGTRGIERASKIMMPGLFLLLIVLVVRVLTLPGASEGLKFMFFPSGSDFRFESAAAALGQVFYSLSLGMGSTLTYGSYLSKKENIPADTAKVAVLDTLVALLAGAAILPAVFAFSMEPGQGPGLIFGTLPKAFQQLAGGPVFGALFFLLIFFAAVTSAIALLECLVAFVTQTFRIKRGKAMWLTALAVFLMGIPSGLSFGALKNVTILHYSIFDFMVVLTDHILLPIIGLSLCIFVGWFWGPAKLIAEMQEGGVTFRLKKAWVFCIRYIAPVLITLVTVMGFLEIIGTAAG